jgi:hypothetical protein
VKVTERKEGIVLHDFTEGLESLEKDLICYLAAQISHKHVKGGPSDLLLLHSAGTQRLHTPVDLDRLLKSGKRDCLKRLERKRRRKRRRNKTETKALTEPKISLSFNELSANSADL